MKRVCKRHHSQDGSQDPGSGPEEFFDLKGYLLRWYDLPHQRLELKYDVGYIEDRQKPLIVIANKV